MQSKKSDFRARVLTVVARIPRGETRSYKEIATLAGNSRASRAVARIMSTNYDPSIPCHRVICTNGTVGGYNRGGPAVKAKILKQEQRVPYGT